MSSTPVTKLLVRRPFDPAHIPQRFQPPKPEPTVGERLTDEYQADPEDYAVQPSPYLLDKIREYGGLPSGSARLESLRWSWGEFWPAVLQYADEILGAMAALPDQPRRGESISESHYGMLAFMNHKVEKSLDLLKCLLTMSIGPLNALEGRKQCLILSDLLWRVLFTTTDENGRRTRKPAYRRYECLRAYVYRQTESGARRCAEYEAEERDPEARAKWLTAYRSRPDVKAADAARKRAARLRAKADRADAARAAAVIAEVEVENDTKGDT